MLKPEKIAVKQAVIVEGRHDKAKLESVIDGVIIQTDGFGIFKNKAKLALIRAYAEKTGIIILTDADDAGRQIRNFLKERVTGEVNHLYIPVCEVEETNIDFLRDLFANVKTTEVKTREITTERLYDDGFIGGGNSRSKRRELLRKLNAPENLSTRALLDLLNIHGLEHYERLKLGS